MVTVFFFRVNLNKVLSLKDALLKTLEHQDILLLIYNIEQEDMLNADILFSDVLNCVSRNLDRYKICMVHGTSFNNPMMLPCFFFFC